MGYGLSVGRFIEVTANMRKECDDIYRFVSDRMVIYALLPLKGDGMTPEEIHEKLIKEFPPVNSVRGISLNEVKFELKILLDLGLVEVEGDRYRRKITCFKLPIKLCEHCGNVFYSHDVRQKYCSRSCKTIHHRQRCEKCRQKAIEWVKKRFKR